MRVLPSRSLRAVAVVGDRFPLYCTACVNALLAELPHAEAERLVPAKLEPFTPHTNLKRGAFLRELDLVRATAAVTVVMPAARLEGNEWRPPSGACATTSSALSAATDVVALSTAVRLDSGFMARVAYPRYGNCVPQYG